nr:protein 4b [Infectious bronchitis virus]
MCVCREYLKLFLNSASILRVRESICFEDTNINPLCFALSLQELLFKQQFFLSFVWKKVVVNGCKYTPVFQKGCCRMWSNYKKD